MVRDSLASSSRTSRIGPVICRIDMPRAASSRMMPNSRALRAAWDSPPGGARCCPRAAASPVRARVSAVTVLPLTAASGGGSGPSSGVTRCPGAPACGGRLGRDIDADGVEAGAGDLLGAVEDGLDGCAAGDAEQAADHAAGAAVEVFL